jgi:hypothetical protein
MEDNMNDATLTPEELAQLDRIYEEFLDCGETEVPYETLMGFAQRGYLECQRFELTPKAHRALADGVNGLDGGQHGK